VRVRVALLVCGALVGLLAFASSGSAAVTQLGSLTADSRSRRPTGGLCGVPIAGWLAADSLACGCRHDAARCHATRAVRCQPRTDAQGRMVATYSRCAVTPSDSYGDTVPAWSGRTVASTCSSSRAAGACRADPTSRWRVRHLPVDVARTHRVRSLRASAPDAAQIELWTPGSSTLRTLRPAQCRRDARSRPAAPVSHASAPSTAQPQRSAGELQVVRNRARRPRPLRLGDSRRPPKRRSEHARRLRLRRRGLRRRYRHDRTLRSGQHRPRVLFGQSTDNCYAQTVELLDFDTLTQRTLGARLTVSGQIIEMTSNGDSLFALVAPQPTRYTAPTCSTPGAPCLLEQITIPTLDRPSGRDNTISGTRPSWLREP